MNAHGRGGTRFTPVFDYVEEHDLQPDALVYFTDLGCSDYPDDPGYPVIWAATERATKPPFGDVIDIDLN
jgi:predicted metal-dependent peptidase